MIQSLLVQVPVALSTMILFPYTSNINRVYKLQGIPHCARNQVIGVSLCQNGMAQIAIPRDHPS